MDQDKFSLPETTTVADLTPKPVPPPTKAEIGRYRRAVVTKTLPTVIACNHKFSNTPPKIHCGYCWEAFFKTVADLGAVHDELTKDGPKALEAKYGTQFIKAFKRFMSIELTKGVDTN